jgi:hypothetical protein
MTMDKKRMSLCDNLLYGRCNLDGSLSGLNIRENDPDKYGCTCPYFYNPDDMQKCVNYRGQELLPNRRGKTRCR